NVTAINLSGAGTNLVTASGGSVNLGAVTDSAVVANLTVSATTDVTLAAVTMDGGGALTLNAAGAVTINGNVTAGLTTINADQDDDGAGTFTVATTKTVATTGGGAAGAALNITAADVALTGSGALNSGTGGKTTITASNAGNINLGSAAGALKLDNTELSQITSGGGLDLKTTGAGVITANAATFVAGNGNVSLLATGTGNVAFVTANSTADKSLTATATGGRVTFDAARTLTSTTGSITLAGGAGGADDISAAGAVTLNAADGINLNSSMTTNGTTNINADTDANDNVGTLVIAGGATLNTSGNTLSITANDLTVTGAINSVGALTTIIDSDNSGIGLGATTIANGLNITGAELQNIASTGLTLQTGGSMVVNGIAAINSNNIAGTTTLDAAGSITFQTAPSTFNALSALADDRISVGVNVITDTGSLALDGNAENGGGGNNDIRFVDGITLDSAGALTLDATTGGIRGAGALTLKAADGVTINDALTVADTIYIDGNTTVVEDYSGDVLIKGAVTAPNGFTSYGHDFKNDDDSTDSNAGLATITTVGNDNVAGGHIVINHTGIVKINSVVDSGNSGTSGFSGNITIDGGNHDGIGAFGLILNAVVTSDDSTTTTTPILSGSGIQQNAAPVSGNGVIKLNKVSGSGLDTEINAASPSFFTTTYEANRNVIINTGVVTEGINADIIIKADLDNDGDGGAYISTAGQLNSARNVEITGSDYSITAGVVDSVWIENDGANNQIIALKNIEFKTRSNTPATADMIVAGYLKSTNGYIDIDAADKILLGANLTTGGGQGSVASRVQFHDAVVLTGNSQVSTGDGTGNILFDSTIDMGAGGFDLTLDAGFAGDLTITGAVTNNGNLTVTNAAVQSYNALSVDSLDIQNVQTSVDLNGIVTAQGDISIKGIGDIKIHNLMTALGITGGTSGSIEMDSYGTTTIDATGDITANGAVTFGATRSGKLETRGNILTSGDAVTFNNEVTLNNSVIINTTNGGSTIGAKINFKDKVKGAQSLELYGGTGGDIDFDNFVGTAATPLGLVTIFNARNVTADLAFYATGLAQNAGSGTSTFGSTLNTTAAAGINLKNNALVFNNDITTTGGGPVTLDGSVTLNNDITIDTGSAKIWLMGAVAGGANKLTLAGGDVQIDNDITVTGGFSSTGSGVFLMADGALINAGSGKIDLTAANDITLGGLLTTNSSALAVNITSTAGSIIDGGDTHLEVDAASGDLEMKAAGTIGSGNPLEIRVAKIKAQSNGALSFVESDDITLTSVISGNGAIDITSGGNIEMTTVNAGSGAVSLTATGTINGGTFTGGSGTVTASTAGLSVKPTANVTNLRVDLSSQDGSGVSGKFGKGANLVTPPPPDQIVGPGQILIDGFPLYGSNVVSRQTASFVSEIAMITFFEMLNEISKEADFFMAPPLMLSIAADEVDASLGEGEGEVPVPCRDDDEECKAKMKK
ncbi:MAG: hypothetical protein BWK73_42695, partial [Thiothrix lacustris]